MTEDRRHDERLLEVSQVAKRFNVSESHVRNLIRTGDLSAIKIGRRHLRIKASAVDAFMEARRTDTHIRHADTQTQLNLLDGTHDTNS